VLILGVAGHRMGKMRIMILYVKNGSGGGNPTDNRAAFKKTIICDHFKKKPSHDLK
jgi:hypothetical protein